MLVDCLGRPIKVGDTVLTNRYGSTDMTLITKVVRINKNSITIDLPHIIWRRVNKPDGTWNYDKIPVPTLRRRSDKVIVVTEQLAYNQTNFPEAYL